MQKLGLNEWIRKVNSMKSTFLNVIVASSVLFFAYAPAHSYPSQSYKTLVSDVDDYKRQYCRMKAASVALGLIAYRESNGNKTYVRNEFFRRTEDNKVPLVIVRLAWNELESWISTIEEKIEEENSSVSIVLPPEKIDMVFNFSLQDCIIKAAAR